MAIKQNVLIMTQMEFTFDDFKLTDSERLLFKTLLDKMGFKGGRITKQWQTIPTNSPKPKKEVKSVFSKQAGVEEM